MDSIDVPQWLMWVLSIGSSLGGSAWLSAIIPAKYFKYLKFVGPIAETLLKVLGGNWGQAESKPPEQIEAEKQAAKADQAAAKTVAKQLRKNHKRF